MAAIRAKNTRPEIAVRRFLHRAGYRFRLHRADLPGRPDIVLPKHRVAVFVHGCFWHWHGCQFSVWPKTRAAFWRNKLLGNVERDRRHMAELKKLGWRAIVIWECELTPKALERKLLRSLQDKAR